MRRTIMGFAAVMALGVAVSSVSAITVDGTGTVQDGWNIKPFVITTAPTQITANGITSFYQNNWSPINYPSIGHVPSPGGSVGEQFDLEEMHVRQLGTVVQMLLVNSSGLSATADNVTYSLGDILLDTDGNGSYDMGLVSQQSNGGLDAGRLYSNITTQRLQNLPGSYRGTSLESTIGPWAVASGTPLGQISIETASHNYGGSEGLTQLTLFSFDLGAISAPETVGFHLDWGCGNDVIAGQFTVQPVPPANPHTPGNGVPEPATAATGALGVGALLLGALKRRRA
jgi:hypothetical protein